MAVAEEASRRPPPVEGAARHFADAVDSLRAALEQARADGGTEEELEAEVQALVARWVARLEAALHAMQALENTQASPAEAVTTAPALEPVPPAPAPDVEPARTLVAAPPSPSSYRLQRRLARFGLWLRNFGLVVLLFVPFQLWGTDVSQAQSQKELRSSFREAVSQGDQAGQGTSPPSPPPVPDGKAVAVMAIPKLGLQQAVVEGTNPDDLRKGPGRYKRTALPGEPGNAAIAGHRTTYGAPFGRLDELKSGDLIQVTTRSGQFRYQVDEQRVVKPSDNSVLQPTTDARLTLTTCHPKYRMSERLIVTAKLMGDAKPGPAPSQAEERTLALPGDKGEILPSLFWAVVLVALGRAIWVLARRWKPRPAYLLAGPFLALVLLQLYTHLDRVLPASI